MYVDFSKLFHRASKDLSDGGYIHIPKYMKDWPVAWKTVTYKSYGKLPQIVLPIQKELSPLLSRIANRKSEKYFTDATLSLEEISTILKYSCGEVGSNAKGETYRAQPSGGGLYPLEAYVLILRDSAELAAGIYHYSVQTHALDILWERKFSEDDISKLFAYEWTKKASAAIVLTANFHHSKQKYGQRGYRFLMLEAGHIGQNVYLTSNELGIKCCAMGGSHDEAVEEVLGIDGENESLIYSLILGK